MTTYLRGDQGDPSPGNPTLITPALFNAYSRSLPSARYPMSLAHEAASMIFLPPTSCSLLMFTSAYVCSTSSLSADKLLENTRLILKRVSFSTSIATLSGSTRKPFKKNAATKVRKRTGTGLYDGKIHKILPSSMVLHLKIGSRMLDTFNYMRDQGYLYACESRRKSAGPHLHV